MAGWNDTHGLHELGGGCWAWLEPDASRGDAERIVVNVDTLYRRFSGSSERTSLFELFSLMAELAR